MITTVAYNACSGYLRAMGNSRTPLVFLILSSLLNIALDILFIVALRMGVGGAALATVIAQGVSAVLCGGYIWKNYREYLPGRSDRRPERAIVSEMPALTEIVPLVWAYIFVTKVFDITPTKSYNADRGSGAPRCPHFCIGGWYDD